MILFFICIVAFTYMFFYIYDFFFRLFSKTYTLPAKAVAQSTASEIAKICNKTMLRFVEFFECSFI